MVDDKDLFPAMGDKVAEVKEEEPVKKNKGKKKGRKRLIKGVVYVDKSEQRRYRGLIKRQSVVAIDILLPLTTKSDSVGNLERYLQHRTKMYFTDIEEQMELIQVYIELWSYGLKTAYERSFKVVQKVSIVKRSLPSDAENGASSLEKMNEVCFYKLFEMIEKQAGNLGLEVMNLSVAVGMFLETVDYYGSEGRVWVLANHHTKMVISSPCFYRHKDWHSHSKRLW
ncbi:hypothetical protein Tco_0603072 [Tanacetum coccineum]